MFAAVFLIFNYKIVMRYLGHDAVAWADEVSVMLFIWIIFWANAFVVRDRAPDQLRSALSPRLADRQAHGLAAARIAADRRHLRRRAARRARLHRSSCGASARRC